VSAVLDAIRDPRYADSLRALIRDGAVLNQTEYGQPFNPLVSTPDDHGTSHISIIDAQRNAVSLTTTVNTGFGSGVTSESTGLLLNNQMDDFSRPDAPNTYGLAPSPANFIAPGKRPLSSMSPTVVVAADGRVRAVAGASGGPRIITATLQALIRVLWMGQDPLQAVTTARLHHQFLPNRVQYENFTQGPSAYIVPGASLALLQGVGNNVSASGAMLGNAQVVVQDLATGLLTGASDPRKDGAPAAMAG